MKIQQLFLVLCALVLTTLLSIDSTTVGDAGPSLENLVFQADIYGDSSLEAIEYLSDLEFHSFGGFGTNAHVFRAKLRSGDEVAFAISANTSAFSLLATPENGDPVELIVSSNAYSAGSATMPASNELFFTWEIEQSGLHINLHRRVVVEPNPLLTTGHIIQEEFLVENLGPPFTLNSLSEYIHLDDTAVAQDYDCDGIDESLLAINTYSSDSYPVFGKLYEQELTHYTRMSVSENYATIETVVKGELASAFNATGVSRVVSSATYLSSTAKEAALAEEQVRTDTKKLLGGGHFPDRWSLRSHNTDDRGAVFIDGKMVVGSRYSYYPDSGWVNVCKQWNDAGDNYVSFASYDIGGCCHATYGFGIRRNEEVVWAEQGSTSTGQGISFRKIVQVTDSGNVTDYEQLPPPSQLDGDWEITVRANGGFAFGLVDKLPVVGSTYDHNQSVNISNLLGQQKNHLHFNAWNDGLGNHNWYFAVSRDGNVLWERVMDDDDGPRGRSVYIHVVVDENGNVFPVPELSLPFCPLPLRPRSAFASTTTSVFDHNLPLGFPPPDDGNSTVTSYLGITLAENLNLPISSYDQHNGFDFSGRRENIPDGRIRAPADGTITRGYDSEQLYECRIDDQVFSTRSCMATIDLGDGWVAKFLHLPRIGGTDRNPTCRVDSSGRAIEAGELIDQIGNTGCSTASHIHMELLYNGVVTDPSGWLGDLDPWEQNPAGTASFEVWEFYLPGPEEWQGIDVDDGVVLASASGPSINIPAGALSGTWTFTYQDTPVSEPNNDLISTGYSFLFEGTQLVLGSHSAGMLSGEFAITIPYGRTEALGIRQETLRLYWWNDSLEAWQELPTEVDTEERITVTIADQFGIFALLGESDTGHVYLPLVAK